MPEGLRAWIALGANLGPRRENFRRALDGLGAAGCRIEALSSLYHSAAVGPGEQEDYLNAVVRLRWPGEPGELLALCKRLEHEAGRRPGPRWGPRPLDLDILLLKDPEGRERRCRGGNLRVPHPGLPERTFVLAPLAEIDPRLELDGGRAEACLQALAGREPHVTQLPESSPWYRIPSDPSPSRE